MKLNELAIDKINYVVSVFYTNSKADYNCRMPIEETNLKELFQRLLQLTKENSTVIDKCFSDDLITNYITNLYNAVKDNKMNTDVMVGLIQYLFNKEGVVAYMYSLNGINKEWFECVRECFSLIANIILSRISLVDAYEATEEILQIACVELLDPLFKKEE